MFDIGFPELVLVAIVGLLVIGPERLPEALRTLGLWLGRMRRSFTSVKNEIEKEIGMDEVRRQLHNEAIMDEMKRIEAEVRNTASDVQSAMKDTAGLVDPASSRAAAAGVEAISSTPDAEPGTEAAADAAASPMPRLPNNSTSQGTMPGGEVARNMPTMAVNTISATTLSLHRPR